MLLVVSKHEISMHLSVLMIGEDLGLRISRGMCRLRRTGLGGNFGSNLANCESEIAVLHHFACWVGITGSRQSLVKIKSCVGVKRDRGVRNVRKCCLGLSGPFRAILSTVLACGLSPTNPLLPVTSQMGQFSAQSVERERRTGLFFVFRELPIFGRPF